MRAMRDLFDYDEFAEISDHMLILERKMKGVKDEEIVRRYKEEEIELKRRLRRVMESF